jgi:hypothetical protein
VKVGVASGGLAETAAARKNHPELSESAANRTGKPFLAMTESLPGIPRKINDGDFGKQPGSRPLPFAGRRVARDSRFG